MFLKSVSWRGYHLLGLLDAHIGNNSEMWQGGSSCLIWTRVSFCYCTSVPTTVCLLRTPCSVIQSICNCIIILCLDLSKKICFLDIQVKKGVEVSTDCHLAGVGSGGREGCWTGLVHQYVKWGCTGSVWWMPRSVKSFQFITWSPDCFLLVIQCNLPLHVSHHIPSKLHYKPSHISSLPSSVVIISSGHAQPSAFTCLDASDMTHTHSLHSSTFFLCIYPDCSSVGFKTWKHISHVSDIVSLWIYCVMRKTPKSIFCCSKQCRYSAFILVLCIYISFSFLLHHNQYQSVVSSENWKTHDGWIRVKIVIEIPYYECGHGSYWAWR